MPNWDDPRSPRREDERDRWRQDRWERETRGRRDWQGAERRAFDEGQSRYGARSGRYEDAAELADRQRRARDEASRFGDTGASRGGQPYGYAGQEYGLEGHPGVSGGQGYAGSGDAGRGPGWGFDRGEARRAHPEHDLDPEYLSWREEQMRAHDRDYHDWRREQHRTYDDQYRQYRNERQRHFGEAFHQWRSQRSMVGGVPDTGIGSVGQGQGGYGDKTGIPGGYNAASAYDRPTGYLDPPGHLSTDPAMSQVGGYQGRLTESTPPAGDRGPEFGREPPQVQAAADGDAQGHEHHRRADEKEREKDREKDAAKRDDAQRH